MGVQRIMPNILSDRPEASTAFYVDVIGLEDGGGADWVRFFGSGRPEVQLSVRRLDAEANVHSSVSIIVDDVDAVYERARRAGAEILYPVTDEEWGFRRFVVRDPNGAVISVAQRR